MIDRARILVIAATERELAPAHGWQTLACGVGPVEAAVRSAAAIATVNPLAIVHVGIAGARRAAGLVPPALVIGESSRYCDLGMGPEWAPHVVAPSPILLQAVSRLLPDAARCAIGTTARVGASRDTPVEAMEGFAVLRAAQLAGVPAIEVRAIANAIEEEDRGQWRFADAFAAIVAVTPHLVEAIARCES